MKRLLSLVFVGFALILTGCESSKMVTLETSPAIAEKPADNTASIVFFRSSFFGGAIQSSVFDVTDGTPRFVAIMSAGTKFAHTAEPGKRMYMVVGEAANFVDADLRDGHTYFLRVSPRIGLWKARFDFEVVNHTDKKLAEELKPLTWKDNSQAARDWAAAKTGSVTGKMNEYLPRWKAAADKAILPADFGRPPR